MDPDYNTSLISTLLTLAITAALSYLLVRFLPAQRWFGRFAGKARLLEIEDMLRVDAKSTLMIVRVEGRRFLLASHTGATPTLITELAASATRAEGEAS